MTIFETVRFVAVREYVRTVRRRAFIFATLLIPVLLVGWLVLFEGLVEDDPAPQRVVVVNESDLRLDAIAGPPGAAIDSIGEEEARARLASGEVDAVYLIPADLAAGAVVERIVPADAGESISEAIAGETSQDLISSAVRVAMLRDLGVPPGSLTLVLEGPQIRTVSGFGGEEVASEDTVTTILAPYAFALIFILSIFITSGYLLQSVASEKENRVVEILLATASPLALMAGKIVGLGAAGLTQIGIWAVAGIAVAVFGGDRIDILSTLDLPPAVFPVALAYFIGGYLLYASIYSAIGAVATGVREAQQLASFGGILGALPIMLTIVFMNDPSSPLAVVLTLVPFTAPAAALQVIAFSGAVPWLLIGTSLVILAASAALAIVMAGRLFRASTLLSGTRPSLASLARTLTTG